MPGAARPLVGQLPVEAVIRQGEESLRFSVRVVGDEGTVFAAQVHMAEQPDACGIALQSLLRGDRMCRRAGRDAEPGGVDDLVMDALFDWLFGKAQSDD